MIAHSAGQSSAHTLINNAFLFIDHLHQCLTQSSPLPNRTLYLLIISNIDLNPGLYDSRVLVHQWCIVSFATVVNSKGKSNLYEIVHNVLGPHILNDFSPVLSQYVLLLLCHHSYN